MSLVSYVSYVSEDDPLSAMDAHVAKARAVVLIVVVVAAPHAPRLDDSSLSRLTSHASRSFGPSVGWSVGRPSVGRSFFRSF